MKNIVRPIALAPIALLLDQNNALMSNRIQIVPGQDAPIHSLVYPYRIHKQGNVNKASTRLFRSFVEDDSRFIPPSLPEEAVRYEMTPLPDALMDTVCFVGNLNVFVTDDDLSELFSRVSSVRSVPAVVSRKPNTHSMGFGFVAFTTVEEKENAIIRFHGHELQGKQIKVESIRTDEPRQRVPEKLVYYTLGAAKRVPHRKKDKSLRAVTSSVNQPIKKWKKRDKSKKYNNRTTVKRVTKTEVERLITGQPLKRKEFDSKSISHKMSDEERADMRRAEKHGFVTLHGTGFRRGRRGSALGNVHRQWCDARSKPQIVFCKASGGRRMDNVIIDLSPLRCIDEKALKSWKDDILRAASISGMTLMSDYDEDNTGILKSDDKSTENDEIECEEGDIECIIEKTIQDSDWNTEPIWKLPVISVGVFEGERANAKEMARGLSGLWGTKEIGEKKVYHNDSRPARRRSNEKRKGLREYRRNKGKW